MTDIQLIIPMAGLGTRFVEAGYTVPKPLIEVDGKPMIEHVVNLFPSVTSIVFVCNWDHVEDVVLQQTLKRIGKGRKVTILFTKIKDKKGPVPTILYASGCIDDSIRTIVSYCDYGTVWDFPKFLSSVEGMEGGIACYKGFHPHMLGSDNYAFCKERDGLLEAVQEKKPFTNDRMSEWASNGTYYFKDGATLKKYCQELVDIGETVGDEFYLSMAYNLMVRDGLKTKIFEIQKMLQWGTPYDLEVYKKWSEYFKNKEKPRKVFHHDENVLLVLPMAGKGDRFVKEGYDVPKPLIEVDGKPMVVQAVECLPKTRSELFICLQEHIDKYRVDIPLMTSFTNTFITPISMTTQGQAVTCAIGLMDQAVSPERPILISACDNGVLYDADKYKALVNDPSVDVIVWTFRNNPTSKNNPNMYAWVETDGEDNAKKVYCKNFDKTVFSDPTKSHAIIGTMFFRKSSYFTGALLQDYYEDIRVNGEFYVDSCLNQCIKAGLKVKVFEVDNYICWGTPNDYKTYNYWREYFDG